MKTVNFIEAVNSGKRFKYAGSTEFIGHNFGKVNIYGHELSKLINAQFELEEKSVTITESALEEAVNKYLEGDIMWTSFKKELGF